MKFGTCEISKLMDVPDMDIIIATSSLPYQLNARGLRLYNRVDTARAAKEYFQRLINENQSKLQNLDSEMYRSRIAKYTTRRNRATVCEAAWREQDGCGERCNV